MIEFLEKGGVLVVPILLCSVLAIAIFCRTDNPIHHFTKKRSVGG